jgi:hypothetical protein
VLPFWLGALGPLFRARRLLTAHAATLKELLDALIAAPADLEDAGPIKEAFVRLRRAADSFREAEQAYSASTESLYQGLRGVIDAQSNSTGWQDFIDLARNLPGLRSAAVERAIRQQAEDWLTVSRQPVKSSPHDRSAMRPVPGHAEPDSSIPVNSA